jgi:hypothetical protein
MTKKEILKKLEDKEITVEEAMKKRREAFPF